MQSSGTYKSLDYFGIDEMLTDEERSIRDTVRDFVNEEVLPIIEEYNQKMDFPKQLIPKMSEQGIFGPTLPPEYGGM